MSLTTWKREFYPTPAGRCKKADALDQSLKKYLGTRKAVLKRHGLWRERASLTDGKKSFCFNQTTCALCKFYEFTDDEECECSPKCPLADKQGNGCCDGGSPYRQWEETGDPEPMIRALRRAIKKQAAAKA